MMESKKAQLFKALGVDTRIKIIELLKEKGPLGVNEIAEHLKISPSAVSQHLKILKFTGFVRDKRQGYWVPYELNPRALEKCHELMTKVCSCEGMKKFHKTIHKKVDDKISQLKEYEAELSKELKDVRTKINKIEDSE